MSNCIQEFLRQLGSRPCYFCSRIATDCLCARCSAALPLVGQHSANRHCQRCGTEDLAYPGGNQGQVHYCCQCRRTIVHEGAAVTANYPLCYYFGQARELLQHYKFGRELRLAATFCQMIAAAYQQNFCGFYLVPVPPRPSKWRKQAWDQVEYWCQLLQRRYRLPVLHLLHRDGGREQKNLGRTARISQIGCANPYRLSLAATRLLYREQRRKQSAGLRLLLLDDVYTTGATIEMCRAALRPVEQNALVAEVRSLTFCLVP